MFETINLTGVYYITTQNVHYVLCGVFFSTSLHIARVSEFSNEDDNVSINGREGGSIAYLNSPLPRFIWGNLAFTTLNKKSFLLWPSLLDSSAHTHRERSLCREAKMVLNMKEKERGRKGVLSFWPSIPFHILWCQTEKGRGERERRTVATVSFSISPTKKGEGGKGREAFPFLYRERERELLIQ